MVLAMDALVRVIYAKRKFWMEYLPLLVAPVKHKILMDFATINADLGFMELV